MRSHLLSLAIGTAALAWSVAGGNVGCSDLPPITTDPAFASSPGSPGRGIGGPGLGNSGAAPSNPSLNQPAGVGTQNPGADPLPGTNGGIAPGGGAGGPGANPGNPGATGTFGTAPSGSSHPMSAEVDADGRDAASETGETGLRVDDEGSAASLIQEEDGQNDDASAASGVEEKDVPAASGVEEKDEEESHASTSP